MTEVTADLLVEHARGDSLRVIARRHGIGHETVRRRVLEEGSKLIGEIERDLLLAELMRDAGFEERAVWPACVIPSQEQGDRMAALDMFSWVVKRLRERGWHLEIVTRTPPSGGAVFMLCTTSGEEK